MRRFTILAVPLLLVVSLLGALPGVSSSQAGMAQSILPVRGTQSGADSSVMLTENAGQSTTLVEQPSSLSSSASSSSVIDAQCPDIAATPGGGVMVVWSDNRLSGTYHLYTQRFDTNGQPIWAEDTQSSIGRGGCPDLAIDSSGAGMAVWGGSSVYAQKLDAGGHPVWPADQELYGWPNNAGKARVATDRHDNWYVAWDVYWDQCVGTPCEQVYLSKLGAEPWNRNLLTYSSAGAKKPDIAVAPEGTLRVAWLHRVSWDKFPVYAFSLRPDATRHWTQPVWVQPSAGNTSAPSIATDVTGDTYVAWRNSSAIIIQKISGQTGAMLWGDGVKIDVGSEASDNTGAVIALAPDGSAYVVWNHPYPKLPGCSGYYCYPNGVNAQKLRPDGSLAWPAALTINDPTHLSFRAPPAAVVDQIGDLYVVWQARLRNPLDILSDNDVYMQSLSANGVRRWVTDKRVAGIEFRSVFLPTLLKNYVPDLKWQVETVKQVSRDPSSALSLALRADGMPEIVYADYVKNTTGYGNDGSLHHLFRDGAVWQSEVVVSYQQGDVGRPQMAFDPSGVAHVAYCLTWYSGYGGVQYAYRDAGGWHTTALPTEMGRGCDESVPVIVDESGWPHITYQFEVNFDDRDAYWVDYAYRDAAGWHAERVDSNDQGRLGWGSRSLALDAKGNPHVTYFNQTQQRLQYAYRGTAGWQSQAVDTGIEVGRYSALAVDSRGRPHIVYIGDGLRYAYLDESGWHRKEVIRGGFDFRWFSLALNNSGQVQFSWSGGSGLGYARQFGDSWHFETVTREGGWGNSMVLDANDRPHIVFYDAATKTIKYAKAVAP